MFTINEDMSIYVTRGDILFFTLTAEENGAAYLFQPGDVVRIKVTRKKACEDVMFQKDFAITEETETVDILLTENETKIGDVISKPVDYWYEVELNPNTNPQTIIGYDDDGPKVFKLYPEGKDVEDTPVEEEDIPVVDEELDLTSTRPVQNQAVARAIVEISEDIEAVEKKVDASIEGMKNDTNAVLDSISDIPNEIVVLKARMNTFTALEEGSTTGDAELADIRNGYDGTVYENAGEAVRGQANALLEKLRLVLELTDSAHGEAYIPSWEDGTIDSSGEVIESSSYDSYSENIVLPGGSVINAVGGLVTVHSYDILTGEYIERVTSISSGEAYTLQDNMRVVLVADSNASAIVELPNVVGKLNELGYTKVEFPKDEEGNVTYGEEGQILVTNADGTTMWINPPVSTDEQIAQAVEDYLEENLIEGGGGQVGETGVGIEKVEQTTISDEDGGVNVVTLTMTDGTTSKIQVKNGSKGPDGPAGSDANVTSENIASALGYTPANADTVKQLSEEISNAAYLDIEDDEDIEVKEKNDKLYLNKKVLFMGDSITELGTGSRGWVGYFNELIKPTSFVNTAVASARWCDYDDTVYDGNPVFNGEDSNHNNTMGNQVEKILCGKDSTNANYVEVAEYADFDMIIIACGTNDGVTSEDIETAFTADGLVVTIDSLDKTKFAHAFRYCVQELQRVYPNAEIFICTPIQGAIEKRDYTSTKAKGDYLKSLCERMSIQSIDTFLCGICDIYEVNDAEGRFLIDGLHPNVAGAKKIAEYNANAIAKHYIVGIDDTTKENIDTGTESGSTYTNIVSTLTDTDGSVYNGTGFKNDSRFSGDTSYSVVDMNGYVTTGFIEVTEGQTIRTSGSAVLANDSNCRIYAFDENKNYLWHFSSTTWYTNSMSDQIDLETGDMHWCLNTLADSFPIENVRYLRLCMFGTGEGLIITIDEEIS